jgi:hypothetical protein
VVSQAGLGDYLGGFFNDHEDIDLVFVGIVLS